MPRPALFVAREQIFSIAMQLVHTVDIVAALLDHALDVVRQGHKIRFCTAVCAEKLIKASGVFFMGHIDFLRFLRAYLSTRLFGIFQQKKICNRRF